MVPQKSNGFMKNCDLCGSLTLPSGEHPHVSLDRKRVFLIGDKLVLLRRSSVWIGSDRRQNPAPP